MIHFLNAKKSQCGGAMNENFLILKFSFLRPETPFPRRAEWYVNVGIRSNKHERHGDRSGIYISLPVLRSNSEALLKKHTFCILQESLGQPI